MMALIGPQLTGGTSCSFVLVSLWGDGVGTGWRGRGRVWGKQLLEMTQSRTSLWPPHPTHTYTQTHTITSYTLVDLQVWFTTWFPPTVDPDQSHLQLPVWLENQLRHQSHKVRTWPWNSKKCQDKCYSEISFQAIMASWQTHLNQSLMPVIWALANKNI